jgi:hypothetical protein
VKTQPLDLYQGDDYAAIVHVTFGGAPADLTGYTVDAQIRRNNADADPIEATIGATISGSDIILDIDKSVTTILPGSHMWDLQLTDATGTVTTIMRGPVRVMLEITRLTA